MNETTLEILDAAQKAGFTAVFDENTEIFTFTESETGIRVLSTLQGGNDETSILFNQVIVGVVDFEHMPVHMDLKMMLLLTDVNNGISTSSFQTNHVSEHKYQILLCNFAPIQDMGDDDIQDIKFCLSALMADLATVVTQSDLGKYIDNS